MSYKVTFEKKLFNNKQMSSWNKNTTITFHSQEYICLYVFGRKVLEVFFLKSYFSFNCLWIWSWIWIFRSLLLINRFEYSHELDGHRIGHNTGKVILALCKLYTNKKLFQWDSNGPQPTNESRPRRPEDYKRSTIANDCPTGTPIHKWHYLTPTTHKDLWTINLQDPFSIRDIWVPIRWTTGNRTKDEQIITSIVSITCFRMRQ